MRAAGSASDLVDDREFAAPRERVAEPEAAGTPSVVRHRELAGEGWRMTAERLAAYLERRSTSWPG